MKPEIGKPGSRIRVYPTVASHPVGSLELVAKAGSRCIISANGVPMFTNVPSFFATNDSKCGFAFFTVTNTSEDQPIVLNFDADHSSYLPWPGQNHEEKAQRPVDR